MGVVLIHGGFHGGWCWEEVCAHLETAGIPFAAPDLPMATLSEDVEVAQRAVRDLEAATGGPVVVVAHSYGGAVISSLRADCRVAHAVFLSSVVTDVGESVTAALQSGPADGRPRVGVMDVADGWRTPRPEAVKEVMYHDCDPAVAERATARLRPQSQASVDSPGSGALWRRVPSTFVVCELDRVLSVDRQRAFAARMNAEIVTFPSGHSVFYAFPEEVAALLIGIADQPGIVSS